jgi:hypothetical protein
MVSAALNAALEDVADIQLASNRLHVERLALVGESGVAGDHDRPSYPRQVGREALRDPVDEMLLLRVASDIDERQNDHRKARRRGSFGRFGWRGLRLGRLADLKRINADRLGDVLKLFRAEIVDREIEPPLHLTIGVLGKTDCAGFANAFEARGDVDAIAHQVAVGLFDHVAEMHADSEFDAALGLHAGVALDEAALHLDGATHGVDHTAELDEAAIARALDDAPAMRGDSGIDQIAAQPAEPRQRAILVRAREPAIADHVRDQDRSNFPDFGHGAPSRVMQNSTIDTRRRRLLVGRRPMTGICATRRLVST